MWFLHWGREDSSSPRNRGLGSALVRFCAHWKLKIWTIRCGAGSGLWWHRPSCCSRLNENGLRRLTRMDCLWRLRNVRHLYTYILHKQCTQVVCTASCIGGIFKLKYTFISCVSYSRLTELGTWGGIGYCLWSWCLVTETQCIQWSRYDILNIAFLTNCIGTRHIQKCYTAILNT